MGNPNLEKISVSRSITGKLIDEHYTMGEVIEGIREGLWKDEVTHLRQMIEDGAPKEDRQKFKRNHLPVFYPCAYKEKFIKLDENQSAYATGLVQFDVDMVVDDATIKKVRGIEGLVYLFISPSGGIKFAISTDFSCVEIGKMGHRFRYAYGLVKEFVEDATNLMLDDSMQNISQGCYVSYDADAFINSKPVTFMVQDQVDKKIAEEETLKQQVETDSVKFADPDDQEVLRALGCIPTELNYVDREPINLSILGHFGVVQGKQVLLNHWSKGDKKKLGKQLDGYCKLTSKCSAASKKVTLGTLFHIAKEHGY